MKCHLILLKVTLIDILNLNQKKARYRGMYEIYGNIKSLAPELLSRVRLVA